MKTPASLSMPDAANSPNLEKWTDFELFNSCLSTLVHSPLKDHQLLWPFLFHYWSVWPSTPSDCPISVSSWQRVCVFLCVSLSVYESLPEGRSVCFPWHGLRLNSRSLHPDTRLSFWAETTGSGQKNMGTHTRMHGRTDTKSPSLSLSLPFHFLFFLFVIFSLFLFLYFVQVKDALSPCFSPFSPTPSPSLCRMNETERE